jgi:recombination protein RecT
MAEKQQSLPGAEAPTEPKTEAKTPEVVSPRAVAGTAKAKMENLRGLLEKMKASMSAVLPRHLTPDRLIKVALVAANRTPRLLDCTPQSFAAAMIQAAELGLEPGGGLGHGYLVPFRNGKTGKWEVVFMPGYRGYIALARRSGEIAGIEAHPVYEKDKFIVRFGLEPRLDHEPNLEVDGKDRKVKSFYAIATMKDGVRQVEFMTLADVEHIRAKSKAKDDGPWKTDYEEMGRKTVVKRLCKYLPLSPELAKAIAIDNAVETGDFSDLEPVAELAGVTAEEGDDAQDAGGSRTDALTQKLTAGAAS